MLTLVPGLQTTAYVPAVQKAPPGAAEPPKGKSKGKRKRQTGSDDELGEGFPQESALDHVLVRAMYACMA